MHKIIRNIDKVINCLVRFTVIFMLIVMSIIVFAQVVFRMAHASIPWSEEVSKYLLVWTTFLGAALCVRKGSLIGLEIIFMIIPKYLKTPLIIMINIIASMFMIFLITVGLKSSLLVWGQTTPVLKMSMGIMYGAIPIGALFMLINTFIVSYYQVFGKGEN